MTGWLEIRGKDCVITVEPRSPDCDRGNFVAKIHLTTPPPLVVQDVLHLGIDAADGWPRYYFDLERAKLEILAWLEKRGQFVTDQFEPRTASKETEDEQA
jgi:hypothetical protein